VEAEIDPELRTYLEGLSEGILPLQEWVAGKSYKPPGYESLPWRSSGQTPLQPSRLGVIRFLEGLFLETSQDEEIKVHFASRAEDPLQLEPHDDVVTWRALRELMSDPQFGVTSSDNLLMDVDGHPISRASFYEVNLPLFLAAARNATAALGASGFHWQTFADDLLNDRSPFWPSLPQRSSTFLKQLGRDLLYAVLGMRNPAEAPWKHAVLIELGEHRRVGNRYSPDDATVALQAFLDVFDEPPSLPIRTPDLTRAAIAKELVPPIGSPPISPRQQNL
jgi:hypothetical protein